jgi:hypothetical protein
MRWPPTSSQRYQQEPAVQEVSHVRSESVHDQSDGLPNGGYLWSISVSRWNSATGVGLCVLFTGMLVIVLIAKRGVVQPMILTVVIWFFLFAGLAGVYSFAKWTIWPPIVLAAVKEGLIVFFRTDKNNYDPVGVVVPWAKITSLGYEPYRHGDGTMHTLVVHLCANSSVPLDQISVKAVKDSVVVNIWSEKVAANAIDNLTQFVPRNNQAH